MSDEQLSWRGTSAHQRTEQRKRRLLLAGYNIVGNDGSSALTVRSVCSTANIGPRHFYESFTDIEELLSAVYSLAVTELLTAVAAEPKAPTNVSVRARVHANLDAAARFLAENPRCGRIIFTEALANETLRGLAAQTLPQFVVAIRQRLGDDAGHRAGSERAGLETTVLSGALTMAFVNWLADPTSTSREGLVSYCTDVTLAILALPPPPAD